MFPLRDENPTLRTSVATFAIIGANLVAWALLQGLGTDPLLAESVCRFGVIPADWLGRDTTAIATPAGDRFCGIVSDAWWTPISSMFMHGGWLHLLGNLWFLYIFGDNVEDAMGPARFVVFYGLCGLAAVAAQMLSAPGSAVPMVGASGAIGGVMGAYAVLYPRVRVHVLLILVVFVTRIAVPAYLMLGYWIVLQLAGGAFTPSGGGGVAFWAHIGGFGAGLVLVWGFRDRRRPLHFHRG